MRTPERQNVSVHERARTKSPVEERERRASIHSLKGGSVRSQSPSVMSSISEHLAKQRPRQSIGGSERSSVASSTVAGSTIASSTVSKPTATVSTPPRSQWRESPRPTSRATSRAPSRATSRARTVEPEESDSEIPGTRDWYLEMRDPPQTATYARGPFESTDLVERLGLNNGEVILFLFGMIGERWG